MDGASLTHSFTPPELDAINSELSTVINAVVLDEELLLQISVQRDKCITAHLTYLERDELKQFCKAELKVNDTLLGFARQLFSVSEKELTGLIRGRKAVKKYI